MAGVGCPPRAGRKQGVAEAGRRGSFTAGGRPKAQSPRIAEDAADVVFVRIAEKRAAGFARVPRF